MDVRRIFVAIGLVAVGMSQTVLGAGQAGWSSGTTQQPTSGFDRYNNQASGAPSISQRAQTAVSDTGTSLRDGMEAGIRAGEQTLGVGNSQSTYSNSGGVASPWPSTTSSAAPAWPATSNTGTGMVPLNSANATSTTGAGWSSIGTGIPAPKLVVPQSPMMTPNGIGTTTNFGNGGTQGGRGPNFPAVAANEQPQMHSVLSDPSRTAASPTATSQGNDWVNTWNNNPATQPASTGRGNGTASTGSLRDSDMVSLPNVPNSGPESRAGIASRLNENPSGNESWNLPQNAGSSFSKNGASTVSPPPFVGSPNNGQANNGQFANQTNGQGFGNPVQNGPNNGGFTQAGFGTGLNTAGNGQLQNGMQNGMPNGSQNGTNQFGRNEVGANGPVTNQPLFTWVLVVLTLAGSLAANFYLGASYLDARQKYQSLVRKTAETFRRVKAAAA